MYVALYRKLIAYLKLIVTESANTLKTFIYVHKFNEPVFEVKKLQLDMKIPIRPFL